MTPFVLPRYAVIGNPVTHSQSPRIHALFADQTGVRLAYGLLPAPLGGFEQAVGDFFAAGGRGLNVTLPFKQDAWRLAQDLSPRAQAAGAVNTLWMHEGSLHGCNTDGVGLVSDLQRLGARLAGARVLLVGAGGAARGVVQPLLDAGCAQLRVVNRSAARALDLARAPWQGTVAIEAGGLPEATQPGGWDLVLNASASSLGGAAPDLPAGLYAPGALAYDMMYAAAPTPFMRAAQADGAARASDGLGMLLGQAAASFALWHGVQPVVEPVLAQLRAELQAKAAKAAQTAKTLDAADAVHAARTAATSKAQG